MPLFLLVSLRKRGDDFCSLTKAGAYFKIKRWIVLTEDAKMHAVM